jgi:protein-tyrosine phosphatase
MVVRITFWILGLALLSAVPVKAAEADPIPFVRAEASSADGANFHLTWRADGVQKVEVFAGAGADAIDRSHAVATGAATGSVMVGPLDSASRWFFELKPDHGDPLVIAERSLHLATAPNFRDFGGYRTSDGHWVRMGLIYRSDGIEAVSDADLARIAALHIRLICDLRTDGEREKGPDRVPVGTDAAVFDVMRNQGELTASFMASMADPDAEARLMGDGGATRIMRSSYRDFVLDPGAAAAYRAMYGRLAGPDALPAMFHCSAGKDRSGWAAAALLTLLGVPRETVMADYLASNIYLLDKNRATLAKLGTKVDAALLEPVFVNDTSYLDAAFAAIQERYGSFDAYLRDGLKLEPPTLAALRATLLQD